LCADLFRPRSRSLNQKLLPKFKIELVDGTVVQTKDLQGKVAVIDFWGTWCKPCIAEIPEYNAFYREYKAKGVVFMALAADSGSAKELREAGRRLKIEYPIAAPSWEQIDSFGEIAIFPTTLVYGPSGKIEKEFIGGSPNKQKVLRRTVDRLLN
jgi:thiol-disulfide isomerase/thioredoxin